MRDELALFLHAAAELTYFEKLLQSSWKALYKPFDIRLFPSSQFLSPDRVERVQHVLILD